MNPKDAKYAVIGISFMCLLIVAHTINMWIQKLRLDRCEAALLVPRAEWCGCYPTNVWVDPKAGKDTNSGADPQHALATAAEAMSRIPKRVVHPAVVEPEIVIDGAGARPDAGWIKGPLRIASDTGDTVFEMDSNSTINSDVKITINGHPWDGGRGYTHDAGGDALRMQQGDRIEFGPPFPSILPRWRSLYGFDIRIPDGGWIKGPGPIEIRSSNLAEGTVIGD